jgi:hypothetical protein
MHEKSFQKTLSPLRKYLAKQQKSIGGLQLSACICYTEYFGEKNNFQHTVIFFIRILTFVVQLVLWVFYRSETPSFPQHSRDKQEMPDTQQFF